MTSPKPTRPPAEVGTDAAQEAATAGAPNDPGEAIEQLRAKLKGLRVAPFSEGVSQAADPAAFAAEINAALRNFEDGKHGDGVVLAGGKVIHIKASDGGPK